MKKSLFALAAVACLGMFAAGCEDENGGCETQLDCVGSLNGSYCVDGACSKCSIKCTGDTSCKDTGNGTYDCVANDTVHDELCESDDDCMDQGYVCDTEAGKCVLESEVDKTDLGYKYVRIEDLSPIETKPTKEDPGVDIDAIVVTKQDGSGTPLYAKTVHSYGRGEGFSSVEDREHAFDSKAILGRPDSFAEYPTSTETCKYYTDDYLADKENENIQKYTYVSLGGLNGYIIVEMDGAMFEGDKINVLELSDCKLANTISSNGQKAVAEDNGFKVQVSVSERVDSNWQLVASGQATKGVLSANIPAVVE